MQKNTKKKLIKLAITALFVLLIVLLDPHENVFTGFNKNINKSYYFEHCQKDASSLLAVVDVSDGDTITVSRECEPVTIRLIGVDTPETVDPRKPVQCFGKEASSYTKEHLGNKKVYIELDPLVGEYDKYGRTLGYVILENGTNYNKELIEKGYAHEYTYQNGKYLYQSEFKEAEAEARKSEVGLWSKQNCSL